MARAVDRAGADLIDQALLMSAAALNALNWPAAGWVITTFSAANTFPPPAGISLVDASDALAALLPPVPADGRPDAVPPPAGGRLDDALLAAGELPPTAPHAVRPGRRRLRCCWRGSPAVPRRP
jgi:hypothetical protein